MQGMELQVFLEACSTVLKDEEFCAEDEKAQEMKEMVKNVRRCCVEENKSAVGFGKWLYTTLQSIITDALHRKKKVMDREKLWTNFHVARSEQEFATKWDEFTAKCGIILEPVVYQHLVLVMFQSLVSRALPQPVEVTASSPDILTFEEINAIRYVGGYVIRSLRKDGAKSELKYLIKEARDTDSEDWVLALDRGGLIHITESFCQLLCSMEYTIRQHSEFDKDAILDDILNNSDVLFNWCLASPMDENNEHTQSLIDITEKWITIRGFSFTKSVLEKFKQENKKTTAKSKPLRRKVSQAEQ